MSITIAVSGKGGVGKTTLCAMIVRHIIERTGQGVLAVDADPNACLGLALGASAERTVADLREDTLGGKLPGSETDRERAFEYGLQQILVEEKGFDLLTMGQPEGPKCYCAVNHLLRRYLDRASGDYRWVVVDNEAGMEHLSRRTTNGVSHLVVVSEPTAVGVVTAKRILGLTERLPIAVEHRGVLWNKVSGGVLPPGAEELPTIGRVPLDPAVLDASMRGANVFELDPALPSYATVGRMLENILDSSKFKVQSST
jgi:CO dehydrogenase maturation factor